MPDDEAVADRSGAALRSEEHAGSKDNLILDIGADVGALAIYTAADRDGIEIQISAAGDHRARSHNVVHPRATRSAIRYAAVFPALAAGDYTVWRDETTPRRHDHHPRRRSHAISPRLSSAVATAR